MANKVFDALAIQQELNKVEGKAEKSYVDNNLSFINSSLEEKASLSFVKSEINAVNSTINDNTLDINTKVSKNATDIKTQSARIDTFTTLSTGSTTGDAELIDARNVNGATYDNVGGAIRAVSNGKGIVNNTLSISKLDDYLNTQLNYLNIFDFKWENKGFDNTTNEPTTSENLKRLVSVKTKIRKNSIIEINSNYSLDIFVYNEDLTYKKELGFGNYFEITEDVIVRLYVKRTDEAHITDSEVNENLKIYSCVNDKIDLINSLYASINYNWVNKGIDDSGNQTDHEVLRRLTTDLIKVNIGDVITSSESSIVFSVYKFNADKSSVAHTDFVSSYKVEFNGYVRLLVKKTNDDFIKSKEAKCITFNIIRDKMDIVHNNIYNKLGLMNLIWFAKAMNGTTGEVVSDSTTRIVSQRIRGLNGVTIKAKPNYSVSVYYYDNSLNFIDETSFVNKVKLYNNGYIRIFIKHNNNETLSISEINNYIEFYRENEKQDKYCVSNPSLELLAHSSRSVRDNKGNIYTVYLGNDETTAEDHLTVNTTYIAVSKFNMATPSIVKTNKILFTDQTFDNGFTNSTYSPYEPSPVIFDNKLYVLYRAYSDSKWIIRLVKVDMDTLETDGKSYETFVKYNTNTWGLDDATLNSINDTEGNGYTSDNALLLSNIVNNGSDYYIAIGGCASNFSCFLFKTTDFINFEFLTSSPMTNSIKMFEPSIAFKVDKIIVAGRNGEMASYNITSKTWSDVVTLPNQENSRPFVFKRMGHVYVARNKSGYYYDMSQSRIRRACMEIFIVNPNNLNRYEKVYEEVDYEGLHYFTIMIIQDECYIVYSTDTRKVNVAKCIGNLAYRKLGMY